MARTDNFTNFATDVANSIREKTGETGLIPASEFDMKIKSIQTGVDPSGLQDKVVEIKENGTYNITADEGYSALNRIEAVVNVPSEFTPDTLLYTELEYLETQKTLNDTGNTDQYLLTDYKLNNNSRIVLKFSRDVSTFGGSMFGVFNETVPTIMFAYHCNGTHRNRFEMYWGNPLETYLVGDSGTIKDQNDFIIDLNKNVFTVYNFDNSVIATKTFTNVEFETPYTTPIMAARVRTDGVNNNGCSRLYSCQIYDNDVLIYDIIPVKDPDGVVCGYNKVDGTFMYNAGTGVDFTAGPVVREVKYEYKRQDKTVEITENGTQTILPDEGYSDLKSVEVITNVTGSGGGDQETGLVERTITDYTNDNATKVETYAFYEADNLISVNFPKATVISNYAFYKCDNLTTVKAHSMTTVGIEAFTACTSLKTIEAPNLKTIHNKSFSTCKALTSVDFPLVTELYGGYSFSTCSLLESVNLPALEKISGYYAFENCTSLKTVDFPNLTSSDRYMFAGCTALESANLPKLGAVPMYGFTRCSSLKNINLSGTYTLSSYAFYNCTGLTKVDLSYTEAISSYDIKSSVFNGCTALETLILRETERLWTLATGVFTNTKIASGTGYIYVPSALIEDYKVATNWSTYAAQFRAIEDYPEICG